MTTLATLVQNTWNILYGPGGFERPWEDQASGTISTAATDLSALVTANGNWFENDVMEFPAGELAFVVVDTGTTVNRGRDGTTAEALSSGDVIKKNPQFPRHKVEQAVNETVRVDCKKIWTWHQDTFTFTVGDHMYDLDQYVDDVVMVYQENLDSDERWHPLPTGWWNVERQINSAVATQGGMLRVKRVWDEDETVYYLAKRRPHLSDLTNLAGEIADMVPYGAAAKLAAGRNVQQKSHRTSERSARGFTVDYETLMGEFLRMRKEYADWLRTEVRVEPEFVPKRRRRW